VALGKGSLQKGGANLSQARHLKPKDVVPVAYYFDLRCTPPPISVNRLSQKRTGVIADSSVGDCVVALVFFLVGH
jgi:hypothetical protein